jgi:predicted transcriptional regulator
MKKAYQRIERTPEDAARIEAAREKFQRERPTLEQLVAGGEYAPPVPHAAFLSLRLAAAELRAERERQGLSLAEVAKRAGMDPAVLSRLENKAGNPTLETLCKVASALGKEIVCSLRDAG